MAVIMPPSRVFHVLLAGIGSVIDPRCIGDLGGDWVAGGSPATRRHAGILCWLSNTKHRDMSSGAVVSAAGVPDGGDHGGKSDKSHRISV